MRENAETPSSYRSYCAEFTMLREGGCRLYYPGGHEISPGTMAATMAHDRKATYMRDTMYDEEGKPEKIFFQRVRLRA